MGGGLSSDQRNLGQGLLIGCADVIAAQKKRSTLVALEAACRNPVDA